MKKNRAVKMKLQGVADIVRFGKTGIEIITLLGCIVSAASALHYDKQAVSFTTLDELFSTGKELKVWSDTTVRIMGISFKYHDPYDSRINISWMYNAGRSIPCTLSVGDTLRMKLYVSYIRKADAPQTDSVCFATGPGLFNCVPLQVASFPHSLITSNSFSGPTSDTAGKCLHFSRDSVFCTLRHQVYYNYYWDDQFHTSWDTTRNALHSWSQPGQFTIKALARCSNQLYTDTLKSPLHVLPSVSQNVTTGTYKSGFFGRMVGSGNSPAIDFSQGANGVPVDTDLVFSRTGYSFSAKGGLVSPGLFDSLLKFSTMNCTGAASDTSTVCKLAKRTLDSLIGALSIFCPSVMPYTALTKMDVGQFCLVKTQEGYYAIIVKIGEYIGGIDREYYYWGYQSDGSQLLNPASTSISEGNSFSNVRKIPGRMRLLRQGALVRLVLPDEHQAKEITIYTCNGTLVHRTIINNKNQAVFETSGMSSGLFIVSVKSDRGVLREVVRLF